MVKFIKDLRALLDLTITGSKLLPHTTRQRMIPYYLKIIVISENYIKDIFQNLYLYRGVPSRIEGFRSLPLIQETVCDLQGVPNVYR